MNTIGSVLVVLAALIASSGRYQYYGYYIYVASVVFCIQNYIHLTRFEITVFGRGETSTFLPLSVCVCAEVLLLYVMPLYVCAGWRGLPKRQLENLQDVVSLVPAVLIYLSE